MSEQNDHELQKIETQVSFTIRSGGTHSAPASRIEKGHAPLEASSKQNSAVLSFRIRSGGAAQAEAKLQDLDTATQEANPAEQGQHRAEAPDICGSHKANEDNLESKSSFRVTTRWQAPPLLTDRETERRAKRARKAASRRKRSVERPAGQSSDLCRRQLECTHNQRGGKLLEEAMDAFSSVAQHPAHKVPLWHRLIDASEAVNRDSGSQEADCSKGLNQAFIQLCLDMPRNAEAAEAAQHTQHCSPWQPFHNAKDRRWVLTNPPDPSKYVWFTDGVLAGKKMCVRKLWNLCTSYTGPPFNIYNPEECPPPFRSLAEAMLQDRLQLINLYKKIQTAASGEEAERTLERMVVLSNEGASLLAVLVMSNIKLGGTLSGPYKVDPANWHQVMRGLQLSEQQVAKVRGLRAEALERASEISMAKQCAEDMLEELPAVKEPGSMTEQDKLQFFDIVEALQCARCKERDLMLGIILRYTWSILTPLQLALSACLYHEHMVVPGSKGFTGFLDSMQFYYHCLVDEALSSWLDEVPSAMSSCRARPQAQAQADLALDYTLGRHQALSL